MKIYYKIYYKTYYEDILYYRQRLNKCNGHKESGNMWKEWSVSLSYLKDSTIPNSARHFTNGEFLNIISFSIELRPTILKYS